MQQQQKQEKMLFLLLSIYALNWDTSGWKNSVPSFFFFVCAFFIIMFLVSHFRIFLFLENSTDVDWFYVWNSHTKKVRKSTKIFLPPKKVSSSLLKVLRKSLDKKRYDGFLCCWSKYTFFVRWSFFSHKKKVDDGKMCLTCAVCHQYEIKVITILIHSTATTLCTYQRQRWQTKKEKHFLFLGS